MAAVNNRHKTGPKRSTARVGGRSTATTIAVLNTVVAGLQAQAADFERRVRDLEAFRWKLIGIACASGGAGIAIGKFLMGGG